MSPEDNTKPDSTESDETKQEKVGYWLKWIKSAKKAADDHWADSRSAYKQYEVTGKKIGSADDKPAISGYPIYWVASSTIEPAFYSKTPKIIARRKYGIENPVALTMGLIGERLGQWCVDNGNYDDTMIAARGDFMHAAKATTQAVYTAEMEPQRIPLEYQVGPDGAAIFYDPTTQQVYDGDSIQEENGQHYALGEPQAIESTQKVFLMPACFDEILHTPTAKTYAEITEMAYRFELDKDEAEEKFNTNEDGSSKELSLPYKESKSEDDNDDDDVKAGDSCKKLIGWECYCKKTKKVYWVCEDYKEGILAIEDDPYEFADFFPSPKFALQNRKRKSLYPTPVWVYLEATGNQLNNLYERVFSLIESVRRRALVFGLSVEVVQALNNLKGQEYIIVSEVQDILEKGGIQEKIQFLPVQELVQAISETLQLEDHFKNNFFEWIGVPEIMRGVINPEETATGQGIASDSAHDRFRYNKKQMVDLARDSANLLLDLALKVFSDEKIKRICQYDYLERGTPEIPPSEDNPQGVPAKPGHYELFDEALNRIKNDEIRLIEIDFETDSTSFRDEAKEIARQRMISDTVIQGLATIGGIQNYEFMQTALSMLLSVLESMGGSSQAENMIKSAVSDLEKRRNAPPPPPEPNVEMIKVQLAGQKQQMDAAMQSRELDIAGIKTQIDTFKAQAEVRIDEYNMQMKSALDSALLEIENQRVANENAQVAIEQFKARIQATESMLEEARLKQDSDVAALTASIQPQEAPKVPEPQIIHVATPQMPPMNFNIEMPKPGKKTATMIHPDGTVTKVEVEEGGQLAQPPLLPLG